CVPLRPLRLVSWTQGNQPQRTQRSAEEKQFRKRERGSPPSNNDTASAYLCVLCGWSPGRKKKPTAEDAEERRGKAIQEARTRESTLEQRYRLCVPLRPLRLVSWTQEETNRRGRRGAQRKSNSWSANA